MFYEVFVKMKTLWVLGALLVFLSACENSEVPENRVFSINDLLHKKVGVQTATTAEIYAAEYGSDTAKIETVSFETLEQSIQALRRGELDAVLCDDAPAAVYVAKNPTLRILNEVFKEESYAGIVAKQNWALLDTVNMALIQMRAMGVYDSIFNSYIGGEKHGIDGIVVIGGDGSYHIKTGEVKGPALKVATNAEFPPYEFRTEKGAQGIDIEIARYIADFMERPLEIIDIDFDEVIGAVDSGKADIGLAAFSVTEERGKIVNFTDNYATSKIVVVVRSGETESTLQRIKDTLFGD